MAVDPSIQDPLAFAALGESDVEDVPIDDDAPTLGTQPDDILPAVSSLAGGAGGDAAAAAAAPLMDADPLQTTRTDTLASYGQLVTAPPYEEVALDGGGSSIKVGGGHAAASPSSEIAPDCGGVGDERQHANGGAGSSGISGGDGGGGSPSGSPSGDAAVLGGEGGSSSRAAAQPLLKVTVSDPVKKVEQSLIPGVSGGYVTYKVSTQTALPSFAHRETTVRRRFKDFVALADLLAATHRGYFIPPRPDKNPVEGQRASPEFVETRRQLLEKYLHRLAAHPVLARSEELRVFLESEVPLVGCFQWHQLQPLQGSTLEGLARLPKQVFGSDRAIPNPSEAAQSTSRTGDLLRRFKELGTSMKGEAKKGGAAMSLDESNLRGETSMVEDYQEVLAGASRKAEKMVKKLEEYGNVLGDLGLSFIKIAKFEDEDGGKTGVYTDSGAASKQMSADTRRVGMAAVRLSRLSRSAVSQDMVALTVLHEELGLTPCITKALREREGQLLTVQSLQAELEKKRRGIRQLEEEGSKVFGGDKAKSRRIGGLRDDVAALEAALTSAEAEYDKVKDRNKQELERWSSTRAYDFAAMLDRYGRVEAAYAQRSLSVWLGVAEEFGAGDEVAKRIQEGLGGHDAGAL